MYGLIGKMTARKGKRDELIEILLKGSKDMPGCRSYVVARDPEDGNAIWVTEVWESREAHRASLNQPAVQQAMARGKPLIESFDSHNETEPVGGYGLA